MFCHRRRIQRDEAKAKKTDRYAIVEIAESSGKTTGKRGRKMEPAVGIEPTTC
jgi:hypothetical protein